MTGAADDGGSGGAPPPPWDAMANLRALGDIQRRGLEAANEVISRLIERTDNGSAAGGARSDGVPSSGDPMEEFQRLMVSGWQTVLGAVGAQGGPRGAPVEGAVSVDPLRIDPVPPGSMVEAEFWLHNLSGSDVADVHLHCGDLRDHVGEAIAATAVTFEPPELAELPDRSSRGIRLRIDVPAGTPAATYRSTIMASNLPEVWLPIELTITGAPTA